MANAIDKIKARHADLGAASEAFAKAGGDPAKMVMPESDRRVTEPTRTEPQASPTPAPVAPRSAARRSDPPTSPPLSRGGRKSRIGLGEPITMKLAFAQIDGLNELRLEAQVRGRHRLEIADVIRLAVDELLARPRAEQLNAIERAVSRR